MRRSVAGKVDQRVQDELLGYRLAAVAAGLDVVGQVSPVERAGVETVVGGRAAVAVVFDPPGELPVQG